MPLGATGICYALHHLAQQRQQGLLVGKRVFCAADGTDHAAQRLGIVRIYQETQYKRLNRAHNISAPVLCSGLVRQIKAPTLEHGTQVLRTGLTEQSDKIRKGLFGGRVTHIIELVYQLGG